MALRVIRETGRAAGYSLATGATIVSGEPLMLASATTVKPYDGTSGAAALGLALEDSTLLPLQSPSGLTAGEGYNYTNFARGGLFSMLLDGGEVELTDDGRGAPFETGDTYTLNMAVTANSSGKLTSTAADATHPLVGYVTDVEGSPVTRLRIKLVV